ncbi:MAG: hypothetical protein HKN87_06860 [Saprospiraceae bacterium]|nr:hypothetical protein [Saprospiraceae bacterium]
MIRSKITWLLKAYFKGTLRPSELEVLKMRVETDPAFRLLISILQKLPEATRRTHLRKNMEIMRNIEMDLEKE